MNFKYGVTSHESLVLSKGKEIGIQGVHVMSKKMIEIRIIVNEIIGFGVIILLLWLDEIIDIPHIVFGAPATPINWIESLEETVCISLLALIIITISYRFLKKIRYLEGFLPVCSSCKRIRYKDQWVPFEVYVSNHSEAVFSHGFCPECYEKYKEKYLI